MARWRSPNFLLAAFGGLLMVCLMAVVVAQHHYAAAQHVYENHLTNVVFTPHSNVGAMLNAELHTVNQWLRVRTVACVVAAVAIVGVLWQVVRRRNARIMSSRAKAEATVGND